MALSNIQINGAAVASNYAGRAPIVISGNCNRYPYTGSTQQAAAISSIAVSSGKLRINLGAALPLLVGDTIQVSGLTGNAAIFNARHEVQTVVSTTAVVVTTNWVAVTSTTGTLTRLNENLLVRIVILEYGSVDARVVDGKFSVDISRLIPFQSIFSLTAGALNCNGFIRGIELEYIEIFQGVNYLPRLIDDSAGTNFIAHNTTDISNLTTAKSNHHQTILRAKDTIIWHEIRTSGFTLTIKEDGVTKATPTLTRVNNHAGFVYKITAGAKVVTIEVTSALKETLTYIVPSNCTGKRLYWLNRLGGYSIMEVHKFEKITDVEKIREYPTESHELIRLYGIEEAETRGEYYKDLIDSPEIRNESGEQVWLVDTNLAYRTERVAPIVTIRTENKWLR
jgi:hypothetical protein